MGSDLNLSPAVPVVLHETARRCFDARNVIGFLGTTNRNGRLWLVEDNLRQLQAAGMYEAALLQVLIACDYGRTPVSHLLWLLDQTDAKKLRAAGDGLPGPGPFQLYRGVCGGRAARRVRGLHWTANASSAAWFAMRYDAQFGDPAVYTLRDVPAAAVRAYVNDRGRGEGDYLVALSPDMRPERLLTLPEPVRPGSDAPE